MNLGRHVFSALQLFIIGTLVFNYFNLFQDVQKGRQDALSSWIRFLIWVMSQCSEFCRVLSHRMGTWCYLWQNFQGVMYRLQIITK